MRTYKIQSIHEVYEDNFTEGESNHVNSYLLDAEVSAENLKDAIKQYFADHLHYSFNFDYCEISEGKNNLHYSNLVDSDNFEILHTDRSYKSFKAGMIDLYSNNISLSIQEITPVKLIF